MKKILVLHTGGTISMSKDTTGSVVLNKSNPLLNETKDPIFGTEIELQSEAVFNLPSACMTPTEMLQLHDRILTAIAEGIDGVVVTHGTDTLEETAYFLDLTLPKTIPVVLTGAMRSSNEVGSDGLHNLQCAVWTAAAKESVGRGTLVVLNDEIHAARYVTKTHTTNVDTFKSPTFGPVGLMVEQKPVFYLNLPAQQVVSVDHLSTGVYLLKAYAGMDATFLHALATPETKGLVIEALGSGNLPSSITPALQGLLDRNIPIVVVSRCFDGVAQAIYEYPGGGVSLVKRGIVFCQGLNGPKARLKLLVGLSSGLSGAALKNYVSSVNS